jgi:hypothetical protein
VYVIYVCVLLGVVRSSGNREREEEEEREVGIEREQHFYLLLLLKILPDVIRATIREREVELGDSCCCSV